MGLEVQNLGIVRGGRSILSEFSFVVAEGETVYLKGPNGVGKTTLLRCIAGFIPASAGTLSLNGTDARDRDEFQLSLHYAGHSDAIKSQMTVAENIAFWSRLYAATPTDPLEAFDLAPIADRLVASCSAGQKRRLGLSRLMVAHRPLWLLDEPTVSLDTASKAALARAITAHTDQGGMALIASHDPDLVAGRTLNVIPAANRETSDPFAEAFA